VISRPCVLAIDYGTTGGRACVFDQHGALLSCATWASEHLCEPDSAPWGRALDADQAWSDTVDGIGRALSADGVTAGSVTCIAVTSQRQGIALLDRQGGTLYVGPNVDLRGVMQGTRLLAQSGRDIYAITGHLPPYLFAPSRLQWFRQHDPRLYERIHMLLMLDGWIVWNLTGEGAAEFASAAESGVLDVSRLVWSKELIDKLELPEDIYPPLVRAGTVVGPLDISAAEAVGLEAGVPVVVAGPDTQCGLLGMGIRESGDTGAVVGWSAPIQQVVEEPRFDPEMRLWATCHVLPGQWIVEANCGPAGQAHQWIRDLLVPGRGFHAVEILAREARDTLGPTADVPMFAFLGPRVADYADPHLLWGGIVFPLVSGYDGFGPLTRGMVALAGLENVAFALRANLERLQSLTGLRGVPVCIGGGLTQSETFVGLLADVVGEPVKIARTPSVSALGAAICGAVGVGLYADIQEASREMCSDAYVSEPERVRQACYQDAYESWKQVYDRIESLSQEMR
jgi:autoinducer 2 (AI-2) kinase